MSALSLHPARCAVRLFMLGSVALPLLSYAAPSAEDYRNLNLALVSQHVLPRYAQLADATHALSQQAEHYCADPSNADIESVITAWRNTGAAWQSIQHIRFGPIETGARAQRIAFWPDPRNAIGRQLATLLNSPEATQRTPAQIASSSIAVQGLPALERLLTTERPADDQPAQRQAHCELLVSISANLRDIAHATLNEWQSPPVAFREVIAAAGQPGAHYQLDREATQDFFKSLNTALELVADHKLARALGPSLSSARPQLAEAWRSTQSLDYIRHNLAAAEALYLGTEAHGFSRFVREVADDPQLDDLLRKAFAQTRASAARLSGPLETAVVDAEQRPAVEQLAREAQALKALVAQRLAPALALPLGFNALDGD